MNCSKMKFDHSEKNDFDQFSLKTVEMQESGFWRDVCGSEPPRINSNRVVVSQKAIERWDMLHQLLQKEIRSAVKISTSILPHFELFSMERYTAFHIIQEKDLLLHCTREDTLNFFNSLVQTEKYQKVYILYLWSSSEDISFLNHIKSRHFSQIPQPILCSSLLDCVLVLKTFWATLTPQREENRNEQLEYIVVSQNDPSRIDSILQNVSGLEESSRERFLMLQTFKSIRRISELTEKDILENTPCSEETARLVPEFFHSLPSRKL